MRSTVASVHVNRPTIGPVPTIAAMNVEDADTPGLFWIEHEQPIALHHEDVLACLTTSAGLCRWLACCE